MRETIARIVCALVLSVVVVLSIRFARTHNPPPRAGAVTAPAAPVDAISAGLAVGRGVYEQQRCSGCHSIAGEGNKRHPLDGVGTRRRAAELKEWITGTGFAAEELPVAIAQRKGAYVDLPPEEFDALLAYLASLRAAR